MAHFHRPQISGIALEKARKLILEQSGAPGRTQGQILGLPIYGGRPASTVAEIAARAHRVGWRYLFVADDGSACSDAVVDFGKSAGGRPVLLSFASSRLARELIGILSEFEIGQASNHHFYYIVLLTIPALNFEIVWFRDAARKHPIDLFRALTPTRDSEEPDKAITARYLAFWAGSEDMAADG